MRRNNNNINEEVILFLGECEIITLNNNHQIALANRTVLLKERMLFAYQNPLSSLKDTKVSAYSRSKNAAIPIEKLIYHESEYKIETSMRPRLLIGRRDEGVDAYLKQLKIEPNNKDNNIVAIAHLQQKFIHGFVFTRQAVAIDFYQSLNVAIFTQLYQQKLPPSLPFNYKLANMVATAVNGLCVINPDDFSEIKQEEEQVSSIITLLKGLSSELMLNFITYLYEMQLKFRIIDDTSKTYATRFLEVFPQKIDKLVLSACQLTSNMFSQILTTSINFINLQELNLTNNCLNDDIFTTITKMLSSSKKLHIITLDANKVTFEKESIIMGFLTSIVNISVKLSLSNNSISHTKNIIKFLILPQPVPIAELNISFNPIPPEDLAALTKTYLSKVKSKEGTYDFKLHLNQLEFQDPQSFQFLQQEYWSKKPNTMFIPMSISKHSIRKKGKELGNTEQELARSLKIEQLFKAYGLQVFRGNFHKLNKIVGELKQLKVDQETIQCQTLRYRPYKQQQELMIIRKMESCLNLEVEPARIIPEMNQTIRFCLKKRLQGIPLKLFVRVKQKIQETITKWSEQQNLSQPYIQNTFFRKGRYQSFYERNCTQQSLLNFNHQLIFQLSQPELKTNCNQDTESLAVFMLYHYLLAQRPKNYPRIMVQSCLSDPRMISLKIARFQKDNIITICEKIRVSKAFFLLKEPKIDFITNYAIETYTFSQAFIESGISSSTYIGMLSRSKIQSQQQPVVLAFIEICKNFLKYLYYTPEEISENSIVYLNSIVAHLSNLQNENDNDFKNVLAEELILHMITFYDSTRYQPLAKGILLSICEFMVRRISFEGDLIKRLAAFLIKLQPESQLKLHESPEKCIWEGKVDWKITDLQQFKSILMNRGKISIKIADAAHPELSLSFQVDELDTVTDVWYLVRSNFTKFMEFTSISQNTVDYYWLCGVKMSSGEGLLKYLPSYEHIGKLIFEDKFQTTFYIRKAISGPQQHSLDFLGKLKYEQLIGLYQQARQSFKVSSSFLLSSEVIVQSIISTIWIDILITEEILLGKLRRQNDEESQYKYRSEREKIANDCITKLYKKYKPTDHSLDETSRNAIILEIKQRQMNTVVKKIDQAIKEHILKFIRRVGIAAFTYPLYDLSEKFTMLINNHRIIFIDRIQPQPTILHLSFANILWFELAVQSDLPVLKIDVVQTIDNSNMSIRKLSIQGDSLWIGQCFAMISQVAKNRLSYPSELLFCNEDSPNGVSQLMIRTEIKPMITFPILSVDKYFAFTLSRRLELAIIPSQIPPKHQSAEIRQSAQILPQASQQNGQKKVIPPPVANSIESALQVNRSSKQIPKSAEIEQIIQAAQRQQQGQVQQQQIITSRKSANSKKDVPRRRSRNR